MRPALAYVVACAASVVALAGDDASMPPPAGATTQFKSADGRVSIELPTAWNLKPSSSRRH